MENVFFTAQTVGAAEFGVKYDSRNGISNQQNI